MAPKAPPNPVDCPLDPEKGDAGPVASPPPKPNFGAAVAVPDFAVPTAANGDGDAVEPEPNTLGFPEDPKDPKGEAEEDASLANPDLAKAEADGGGFSSAWAFDVSVFVFSVREGFSKLDLAELVVDDEAWSCKHMRARGVNLIWEEESSPHLPHPSQTL